MQGGSRESHQRRCSHPRTRSGESRKRPANSLTLRIEDEAEALGISRAFAYEAVSRREIPSIRSGRRILIPKVGRERMLGASAGHSSDGGS
jgi:excisionase family DNA binding protein